MKYIRQMMRKQTKIVKKGECIVFGKHHRAFSMQKESFQKAPFEKTIATSSQKGNVMQEMSADTVSLCSEGRGWRNRRGLFHCGIVPASHLWPEQRLLFPDQYSPCYLGASVSEGTKSEPWHAHPHPSPTARTTCLQGRKYSWYGME